MNSEDLKRAQMAEILKWAGNLDTVLTPDKLVPTKLKEFPQYIESSENLKRLCKHKLEEKKEEMQKIKDVITDAIEQQEYVFKYNPGGMPVTKKKFNSAEKRDRELRVRLGDREDYQALKSEAFQWEIMYGTWIDHINRLRREFELLKDEYIHNGAQEYDRIK